MNKRLEFLKYIMIYRVCMAAVSVIVMEGLAGSKILLDNLAGAALWLGFLFMETVLIAELGGGCVHDGG